MMRAIVDSSLRFRLLVVAVAAATLVGGASRLRNMPVDVLPEFVPPTVEIQTEALGLSAAETEQLITVPLEQDLLNGVAFLDDIRSESVPGLSRILLVFEPGTDIFQARQVVAERLTQAHALPNVSKPPQMLQPLSSTNRAMMIGVSSTNVSALKMSVLARWTIAPRLVGVPGVANVAIWGQQDRQLQVQVKPERLRAQGVSLGQVVETAANSLWVSPLTFVEASTPGTGGFIDTPNQRLGIQHLSPIRTPADLAKVRVDNTSGRELQLGDVASVVEDHQPLIGDAVLDADEGLLFVIEKFPEANTLDVTRGVEDAIEAMRPGLSGVEFDTTVYRPASYIESSINKLTWALIFGAVALVLLLAAFFFRWRTALIAAVVIPLSLVVAALVLDALGTTMNAIILAGLVAALILVIDDAVVDVENVERRLREHRRDGRDKSTAAVVLDSALQMRGPIAYATLIIALAVLPVFFLDGLSGAFFPDLAGAFLLALLASMAVALTVTPALSLLLLSRASLERESPPVPWLQRSYEGALSRVVNRPRISYVAVGAVALAALAAVPFLGQSLLPTFKESQLLIRWDGPPGTSLPEMNRITALASDELRSIPGVRNVGAHVGRAVTADQVVGVNSGELWASIDPDADYDATVASIRRVVDGYPGFSRDVQTFSKDRVREVLTGADRDLVVRVYGEEPDTLRAQGEKTKQMLSEVDGLADVQLELQAQEPTLEVEVDLAAAQRHEIKPGDVRRAATTLLSGIQVGSLFEEQKVFDVVVWGEPETRNSLTSIQQLLIDKPEGGHVRLGDVAKVRIAPNASVIERQAVSRYLDVSASISGRNRGAVVRDVEDRLQDVAYPLEYHAAVVSGETQPRGLLISIGIAGAIGIFLLLQAFFGSWRLATLCFLTFPVAVAGGVLTALAFDRSLSFGSYLGLVAVFGLAVRSGLLLVDRFRRIERADGEDLQAEALVRAARDRMPATLLTALAVGMVMLALAIFGGNPGYELLRPLAVVVLGGLVTSTLLTLFVLPAFYLRFCASPEREPETELAPEEVARPEPA
jgi:CzcA family heavy metal efflux pump